MTRLKVVTCAILTIGSELTRGDLRDRNGHFLASELTQMGYDVSELCSVDDNAVRIIATLRRLAAEHAFVLVTGGLGPTTDDLTSTCAARALGVPVIRNEQAYLLLSERMRARGRPLTASSEKQADFPQGAIVLSNSHGTAPGFSITFQSCQFFFMPGVPAEMEPMFEREVRRRLPAPSTVTSCIRLQTFGLPEVEVNDRLAGIERDFGVLLGYRASLAQIEVKIFATSDVEKSPSEAAARARVAADVVQTRLAGAVFAEGSKSLPESVGPLLCARHLSLGLAESCTGGLASHLLTAIPGASECFKGGVVSYDNSVKETLLGVDNETLRTHGAVSEPVARQMAEGARKALGTDLALSFTGIAGPNGGSENKPVGLVHFALATADNTRAFSQIFRGTRAEIQHRAALTGLWYVRDALLTLAPVDSPE
jgi:nicotinamide-nucleotide amidase